MKEKINKKTLIVIIAIIVVLLIAVIFGGILIYKNANTPIETEWAEFYYQTLEKESKKYEEQVSNENGQSETKEFDIYAGTSNAKIQFIQLKEDTIPIMAVSYEKDNQKSVKIYSAYESNDENAKYMVNINEYPSSYGETEDNNNYDIQLLYNLEKQRYIWYIHSINENKNETFSPIISNLQETQNEENTEEFYYFTEEGMKANQVAEDGTPTLSKFEKNFITIDNTDNETEIGDIHNIDEKILKSKIKLAERNYKDVNTFITEKIKTETENKINELNEKNVGN